MEEITQAIENIESRIEKGILPIQEGSFRLALEHLNLTRKEFFIRIFSAVMEKMEVEQRIHLSAFEILDLVHLQFPQLAKWDDPRVNMEEVMSFINGYGVMLFIELSPIIEQAKQQPEAKPFIDNLAAPLERYNAEVKILTGLEPVSQETIDFVKQQIISPSPPRLEAVPAIPQEVAPMNTGDATYEITWNGSFLDKVSRHLYSQKCFAKPTDFAKIFQGRPTQWLSEDLDKWAYLVYRLRNTSFKKAGVDTPIFSVKKNGKGVVHHLQAFVSLVSDCRGEKMNNRSLAERGNKIHSNPQAYPKTVAFVEEVLHRIL